jgi:hypothetical protein
VKRSPREGRWADLPSRRARFIFEAAFLLLVALGAALMELRPLAIVLLMGCAWLLVALIERASSRETGRGQPEEADEELPFAEEEAEPEPPAGVEPVGDDSTVEAHGWFRLRRRRPAEAQPSPTAEFQAHEPATEPEVGDAEPEEAPSPPAEATVSHPSEETPGPAVTKRPLDLPGLENTPASIPAPRPRRALARSARRVVQPPAPPPTPPPAPPAREWNLWDLERRAREQAGNARRDEEWSALFTHLRVFANTDGVLPKEFDKLVRESFGELIEAA